MADLPSLLLGSLVPATRKQSEQSLNAFSIQPGFLSHLLKLVLDPSQDRAVRLSASVYLKNITKSRWEDDVQPLTESDKSALRQELVPAMMALSNQADKSIRVQVAESVSLIAELDFPVKWPDLIDQLVGSLSATDYNINIGVLQTGHSIFRQWRAHVRSDELFTEINLVLSKFITPFLGLFRQTAPALLKPESAPQLATPANLPLLAEAMVLLLDVYYDFTCQDLPPAFEDSNSEFFSPEGWFPSFINWIAPQALRGDPDDSTASLSSQVKTNTLEIAELFMKMYPEQLTLTDGVKTFVQAVWALVGSNKLPSVGDDQLVSQSLRFISSAIRTGYYRELFSAQDTIPSLVQGVVVPNVTLREHDVEQFEDDPLEFIRLDLAVASTGSDLATRRQAAADVLQALVSTGFESEATNIVGTWITSGLAEYESNKAENWKAKDSAIYLLTAVATRGSTSQSGVTSTNALVDVIQFFSTHVFQDLEAAAGTVHPILAVDAIRFLYTFRNQLTKEQLLSVLPLLVRHISSDNYVASTYAAITIDRILFIKRDSKLIFTHVDTQPFAEILLNTILAKIASAGTPEKVAENDHLMKCVMRVIVTARHTLEPTHAATLSKLVSILGVISQNPSNPRFDQYIFESISGLMRFVVANTPGTLSSFERTLFGPFTEILQRDIDQYIPYVFQILAQMLELHTADIPPDYRGLLPFLLTPAIWQQKGSVPGLVKLLKAFLARDSKQMIATGQVVSILAVIQQRLIPSKLNDTWGFELMQAVIQFVPPSDLQQYFQGIMMTLLTRLQTSKTDKYVVLFSRFLLFGMAINVPGLTPDYFISAIEAIQPQLWSQLTANFLVSQAPKMPHKDRKLAVVGLTRMLTQSALMVQPPSNQAWPSAFTALVKIFSEPQYLDKKADEDPHAGITQVDYEEQTAGYQAAYSRLAAADTPDADPVDYVANPQQFVGERLVALCRENGQVKAMIAAADSSITGPFLQALASAGYQL